ADMTMEDVQAALRRRGVDAGPLLDTLAGSSFSATVAKILLRVVQMADRLLGGQAAAMMRALMVEMLAGVDMDAIGNAGFGPGFVEVIIGDRNQAVVDALKAVIERPDPPGTVAIFYGAGHMNDLSHRLEAQLGYRMDTVEWIPAITVDLEQTGLSEADLAAMRRMVKGMVGGK
ncbi:MAG: hypothetical protein KDA22_01360, partial [Phycisphaerales bacterium]|nr:hypothetical protein [Phycisphaerales bacterium]